MFDPDKFREPRRARRIRDRDRMRARAVAAAKMSYAAPDSTPRDDHWIDLLGQVRSGTPDWEAVFDRRRVHGWIQADYLASCSCHMCGNPRKHWNASTIQEVRAQDSDRDRLREEGLRAVPRLRRLG